MARPPITELSPVHRRILTGLCDLICRGESATASELAVKLNLAGPSSLNATIKVMERNGYLSLSGGGVRGKRCIILPTDKGKIAVGLGGVPVLGSIPAGPLSEVFQQSESFEDLGTTLPHQPGDFLLIVHGHSMIGDGILPGDKVLLRPGIKPQNGEIAAVHFGDDYLATLKHVFMDHKSEIIVLRASNPEYPDVEIPGSDLSVVGVFRGLIRSA